MKSHVLLIALFLGTLAAHAQPAPQGSSDDPSGLGGLISSKSRSTREMVLGKILQGALENMHLSNKKVSEIQDIYIGHFS